MPSSKKEGLLFSFIMSAVMIYLMAALNFCVQTQSLTSTAWLHAALTFIPGYIIGMLCDLFICSPLCRKITFSVTNETDQLSLKVFIMRFCMVILMTICMTLFGQIAGGGRGLTIVTDFFTYLPYNFTIALPIQMLIVAPLSLRLVQWLCASGHRAAAH